MGRKKRKGSFQDLCSLKTFVYIVITLDFETGRVTEEDREEDEREVGYQPWWKKAIAWIF